MINLDKLKDVFKDSGTFMQAQGAIAYTNNLVYCDDDEDDSFTYAFFDTPKGIVITDMAKTYTSLMYKEYDILYDEELIPYRDRVLEAFDVTMGPNHELMVIASKEEECPFALGNLTQAMILLNYLDLQFE